MEVESPQWSPDGKRIAFVRDYDQIYVINADGSGERRIGIGYGPTWSPDGKELALLDLRTEKLTIITPTGRRIRQLRSSSVPLDWSPDGRSILIVRGYIFAIDVATSRAKRLTRSGCDLNPEWSPNGRKIVFLSGRGGSGCDDIPTAVLQIYVMNADGTKQQRLTR